MCITFMHLYLPINHLKTLAILVAKKYINITDVKFYVVDIRRDVNEYLSNARGA